MFEENKPFILQELLGKGIKYFCDLIGPDRYFKDWKVIKLEFDSEVNHFLDWYGLVQPPKYMENKI